MQKQIIGEGKYDHDLIFQIVHSLSVKGLFQFLYIASGFFIPIRMPSEQKPGKQTEKGNGKSAQLIGSNGKGKTFRYK